MERVDGADGERWVRFVKEYGLIKAKSGDFGALEGFWGLNGGFDWV
jgi:hypothetical protein